jgi:hypothetical protein
METYVLGNFNATGGGIIVTGKIVFQRTVVRI